MKISFVLVAIIAMIVAVSVGEECKVTEERGASLDFEHHDFEHIDHLGMTIPRIIIILLYMIILAGVVFLISIYSRRGNIFPTRAKLSSHIESLVRDNETHRKSSINLRNHLVTDGYKVEIEIEIERIERMITANTQIIKNMKWMRDYVIWFKDIRFVENDEVYQSYINTIINEGDIQCVINASGCGCDWRFTGKDREGIKAYLTSMCKKHDCKPCQILIVYDADTPTGDLTKATIGNGVKYAQSLGYRVVANYADFAAETKKYTVHWLWVFRFVETFFINPSDFDDKGNSMYVGGPVTLRKLVQFVVNGIMIPVYYFAVGGGRGVVLEIALMLKHGIEMCVREATKTGPNDGEIKTSVCGDLTKCDSCECENYVNPDHGLTCIMCQ